MKRATLKRLAKTKKIATKAADWFVNLFLIGFGLWALYWIIIMTVCCSFHIPTQSMTPTLVPDDWGLVNKLKLGARVFNIFDAAEGKPYTIRRLPGYGKLDRQDVIIFNFPYEGSWDSISMNVRVYYCKRAIAVPGDTLEIRDCFYHVRGVADTLGVAREQERLREYLQWYERENPDRSQWPNSFTMAPRDTMLNWTIANAGPWLIPGEGTQIDLDRRNWLLYKKYIEWETGKKLEWRDSVACLDGKLLNEYTFQEDYCFVAGDHAADSRDSRYFGLVPQKFIVGTAGILWNSKKKSRILKRINVHD